MDRPNRENYNIVDECFICLSEHGYVGHLEKYIDELEENNKILIEKLKECSIVCRKYEKALEKACEEWEKEVPHCDFLLIKNKICDEKCGACNLEKRKNYRKEWCMQDED